MLSDLLGSLDIKDFFDKHYEKTPILLSSASCLSSYFDIDRFEQLLCLPGIRPLLRIVKEQDEDHSPLAVTEQGQLKRSYILDKVSKGYTLVLNDVHRLDHTLQSYSVRLGQELGVNCSVNAYLTPPGTQALKPHFDSHDIFAVQCEGSKQWYIQSSPTVLPSLSTPQPIIEDISELDLQPAMMKKNNIMYLPRGCVHYAIATNEPSLHLTLGLYPVEIRDLLSFVLEEIGTQNIRLRSSVALGARNQAFNGYISEILPEIVNSLLTYDWQSASSRYIHKKNSDDLQPMELNLSSVLALKSLHDFNQFTIWLKPTALPVNIASCPQGCKVYFAGEVITLLFIQEDTVRALLEGEIAFRLDERINSKIDPFLQVGIETLINRSLLTVVNSQPKGE